MIDERRLLYIVRTVLQSRGASCDASSTYFNVEDLKTIIRFMLRENNFDSETIANSKNFSRWTDGRIINPSELMKRHENIQASFCCKCNMVSYMMVGQARYKFCPRCGTQMK